MIALVDVCLFICCLCRRVAASSIGSWMERYRLALTDDIALAARAAGDSHNPISELIAEMEVWSIMLVLLVAACCR